jgi:hypothetical protein
MGIRLHQESVKMSLPLRQTRRALKEKLPFVRRREYDILARKYAGLITDLGWHAPLATTAKIAVRKAVGGELSGDICFFVTHASTAALKANVVHHVEQLLMQNILVVLIVNTDLPFESVLIDEKFAAKLSGIFIRENLGFDFAAWAHAHALCPPTPQWTRLFLVNDSMIGPLNTDDFSRTIARLRASSADVIGLVQNTTPLLHLQSFFLAFTQTALMHPIFKNWMTNVRCLKEKIHVIDVYETRLTQMMADAGLRTEAMFASLGGGDATIARWENLLDAGFPYVKASVAKAFPDHPKLVSWC